ncbi:hypothetical protein [Methylorubrum thiocyanatum]|uniref:hypothetical protein n=1 Tax=Methylorubrum thiocyanatum TaxID=47958 RepID=UPI0035C824AE
MKNARVQPARHRWFDEWRGASGHALRQLVEEIAAAVAQHEADTAARKRARRGVDHHHHLTAVEGVVANLAHTVLMPPETGRIAVLLKHGARGCRRYDNPAFGKPFSGLLSRLDAMDVLSVRGPSSPWGEASSIAPTVTFASQVRGRGIRLSDFGRLPGEETILLKHKARKGLAHSGSVGGLVDYEDTASTVEMRKTVEGLNIHLEGADVTFVDDGRGPIDHRQRRLLRHFVQLPDDDAPRFDRGGRLFGGFWQNLKRDRRAGIRVEEEPVVDLDFASMFPRLAYATTGKEPPEGDLYAIEGLGPEHRPALKLAVNTLLFDDFRRSSWPAPASEEDPRLPAEWTVARTKAAFLARHPALRGCFGVGLGYSLMHRESVILIHVLEEMRSRGVVGLGLHDGILVPWSRASEAKAVMEMIGREIISQALPVTMKTSPAVKP